MDKRSLYYRMPPWMRHAVRRIYYFPYDLFTSLTNRRHKYEPPKGQIFTGSGNFIAQGQTHLKYLTSLSKIQAHHTVLDVGSGMGRTAVALCSFLSEQGSYYGFDIMEKGIDWCRKKIGKDFPNFHFEHVKLGNDLYNEYSNNASNFRFPYQDEQFDIIFSFSVFTHMLPDEIQNYLKEIHRTLKEDGQCLCSFFLYDQETTARMKASQRKFNFTIEKTNYRLMSEKVKSANVALDKNFLRKAAALSGLEIIHTLEGYWSGDQTGQNDFQDIVVFEKAKKINT